MPRQARPAPDTRASRTRMVMRQLAGRGVRDQRVLAAMHWAPREWFLPPHLARDAYNDAPLPIGSGQTISQPFVVIIVTAAAPRVPQPLAAQLKPGGRLVIPVGDLATQELVILERSKNGEGLVQQQAGGVRFVPLN